MKRRNKRKKAKASLKKLIRQEKKQLQQFLETVNYFTTDDKEKLTHMEEFFKLVDSNNLEVLRELRKAFNNTDDLEEQRDLFLKQINLQQTDNNDEKKDNGLDKIKDRLKEENDSLQNWSEGDVQLLAKGFNLYPAGTSNRWEILADYIKQHSANYIPRKSKEILVKVREMQKVDPSLKTFLGKEKGPKIFQPVENVLVNNSNDKLVNGHSKDNKDEVVMNGHSNSDEAQSNAKVVTNDWTAEEQKLLENALKSIPQTTADRWDRIAEKVPGRSKKDCMKRYKELVELIKSKKKNSENSKG